MGDDIMSEPQWVTCPICNNRTRIKIRRDGKNELSRITTVIWGWFLKKSAWII